jgi:hypothetical protein
LITFVLVWFTHFIGETLAAAARRLFDLNDKARWPEQNSSDRVTTFGDSLSQSIRITFSVHTNGELMTQQQILCFKPGPRLE